jgi:hypothetical protein
MSVSRRIHFNALPESVRRRWADLTSGREQPGPLYAEPQPSGTMPCGLLALLGLTAIGFLCWYRFGALGEDDGLQSPTWLIIYAGGGFMLVHGILGLMRRISLRKALPFAPGRYLFALDFVEAHGEVLELWPLAKCRHFSGTHHHSNGVYTHTSLTFVFDGARRQSFTIFGKDKAERVLQQLGGIQRAVSDAAGRLKHGEAEEKDLALIFAFDPFFAVRTSDAWDSLSYEPPPNPGGDAVARPLPGYLAHVAPIALIASVVLGTPIWYARNLLSDQKMWEDAQAATSSLPVRQYLDQGGRRVE